MEGDFKMLTVVIRECNIIKIKTYFPTIIFKQAFKFKKKAKLNEIKLKFSNFFSFYKSLLYIGKKMYSM